MLGGILPPSTLHIPRRQDAADTVNMETNFREERAGRATAHLSGSGKTLNNQADVVELSRRRHNLISFQSTVRGLLVSDEIIKDSGSFYSSPTNTGELIPDEWKLPETFRRRLGDQVGRQRAMIADGHLLLILHAPPTADDTSRLGRVFWRNEEGQWFAPNSTDGAQTLAAHILEFRSVIEKLDAREAVADSADDFFSIVSEATPLYRTARNFQLAVQNARDHIDSRDIINLRDEAYNLERMTELMHQDAKHALDFSIALRAEQQAHATFDMGLAAHRLNVLVAFFFPIATLCAVFGTNLATGLEKKWAPYPFVMTLVAGLALGWILKLIVTRNPTR